MNRSDPIFHIIALIILVLVFFLIWNFTNLIPDAKGGNTADRAVQDTLSIIYGHLYKMIPICCVVILLSLAVAFFLEEWLPHKSLQYRIIERIIAILASIPSLIYGLLGIYLLVVPADKVSYYQLTIIVSLLVMPYTIQSTQKAIQGVDISVREAVYALGANRWKVITGHVFPHAFPIISGGILSAISRVLATAALIIVVCDWKIPESNSTSSFGFPSSVVVLLLSALSLSVLSSLVAKNVNHINLNGIV